MVKYKVVRVSFFNSNRKYVFSSNEIDLKKGDFVIVESEKGIQFGKLCSDIILIEESKLIKPLKNVIRKATIDDIRINERNQVDSIKALKKAKEISKKLNVLSCSYGCNLTSGIPLFLSLKSFLYPSFLSKMEYPHRVAMLLNSL